VSAIPVFPFGPPHMAERMDMNGANDHYEEIDEMGGR
jgi:hypothetical protein